MERAFVDASLFSAATALAGAPAGPAAEPHTAAAAAAAVRAALPCPTLSTPFGPRPLLYCDWAASGRPLAPLDAHLASTLLPLYGNAHSQGSAVGRHSAAFWAEARDAVAAALGARTQHGGPGSDLLLFTGAPFAVRCSLFD